MDTPHGTMVSDYHSLTREAVVKLLEQRDAELKVKDAGTRIFEDPLRKQAADCFADASLLADIITAKFAYHQPEYRQCSRWKQHGINIPTSTVNHWIHNVAGVLYPLYKHQGKLILQSPYLQVDEDAYASLNVCGKTRMGKNKHKNTRVPVPHSLSIKKAISAVIVFIISIASRLDMRFPSLCFTLLLLYRT